MSLKAFHIVFVIISNLASFFVAGIGFAKHLMVNESMGSLMLGIGGLIVGIALLIYGRFVLKKLRTISYL